MKWPLIVEILSVNNFFEKGVVQSLSSDRVDLKSKQKIFLRTLYIQYFLFLMLGPGGHYGAEHYFQ